MSLQANLNHDFTETVAPAAQLVASRPVDGWVMDSNLGAATRSGIFAHTMARSGE